MAASANNQIRVTELSYDSIRANLKQYLENQTGLQDYNFSGSIMSVIVDTLALNTYYNAYYGNMIASEMFIDTAVLRDSAVSRAKELGYTPRSVIGSSAVVNVVVNPGDSPAFITVDKGTKFKGSKDGFTYTFSTAEEITILNASGVYTANIQIYEGDLVSERYTVSDIATPRFIILNENIDTTSLTVRVQDSSSSTNISTWTEADDILDVDSESLNYFLEEDTDGKYVVQFGDGIIGKQLTIGNIVIFDYRVSNGIDANEVASFSEISSIGGYGDFAISLVSQSTGGQDRETIEQIRFNAPRSYDKQNRAVTSNDYKQHVLEQHSDIFAISVWGGEENSPPIYGKVYISAKPNNGFTLTNTKKKDIVDTLEKINVHSIDPVMVDASFVYIQPTINANYDPTTTTLSAGGIRNKIGTTVNNFETNELSTFGKKFRHAELVKAVLDTDVSIVTNEIDILLQKRFTPVLNSKLTYSFPFNAALKQLPGPPGEDDTSHFGIVTSTLFTLPGITQQLMLDDNGNGIVRAYYERGSTRVFVDTNVGTVDYSTGLVKLINFSPSSIDGSELKVIVEPNSGNFTPVRNQILLISDTIVNVYRDDTGELASSGVITTSGTTETINESAITTTVTI